MTNPSPLARLHTEGEALIAPYGLPDAGVGLVQAFDPIPVEYAAIRTSSAVFDMPHRATLEVNGKDRVAFLNNMITNDVKTLGDFASRRAFWLNRKGRIDADLRVVALPDRILLDVDVFAADRARTGLDAYIISEDCAIKDVSASSHRLSLHGPAAAALLARLTTPVAGAHINAIEAGQVSIVKLGDAEIVVDRWDWAGTIGLELLIPAVHAEAVYEAISTPWSARANGGVTPSTDLARRIGWHALNIARIEAGTPLYYADFGPDSLPAEAGARAFSDHVSLKKGCYLGQEIVARMHSLGHPKQRLMALKMHAPSVTPHEQLVDRGASQGAYVPQAETGSAVLDAPGGKVVGAVTSSCVSPMLGSRPIAIAMVKWGTGNPGTQVFVDAQGTTIAADAADLGPMLA